MSNSEIIKQLRGQTGAKILDCKNTLAEANDDYDKALELLKKKGIESAKKRTYRLTKSGMIGYYVHNNQYFCGRFLCLVRSKGKIAIT